MKSLGKLYKIGELAELSNVSKRTIDYYTKIGLLQCERSETNYRFYREEAMEELKFIEECKKVNMTLDQIKQRKMLRKSNQVDQKAVLAQAEQLTTKMEYLQAEIKEMYAVCEKMDEKEQIKVINNLKPQTLALVQLLTPLSKHDFPESDR